LPAYDFSRRTIENNSDNFSVKWRIPGHRKWSMFYNFGLNGILGLSYTKPDGSCFSWGAGVMAKERRKVEPEKDNHYLTVDLTWNAGLFYDRNGSLMASLLFSGSPSFKAKLNVFPGVIRAGGISPGFFMAVGKENEFIFGAFIVPLPLGLAFQNP